MDPDPLTQTIPFLQTIMFAMPNILLIVAIILLVIVNAIISGSEVSYFRIDKSTNDNVSKLIMKPEKLLVSILLTYNLLNIAIITLLIILLNRCSVFVGPTHQYTILKMATTISVIILLLEIIPKIIATHNPQKYSESSIAVVNIFSKIMGPVASLLLNHTHIFSRNISNVRHDISVDELSKALEINSNEDTLEQEKEMLEGIIRFKDKTVDDIKISRSDMVAINIQTNFDVLITFIVNAGFSRIPVYEESADNIKGILYVKDLLPHLGKPDIFNWQSLIRPAYFVPGTKRIDDLLEEFRTNKIHMAIIVDEYGGTSGLVTMEDILEEIVGDISDEYDEELPYYTMAADGSYLFEGRTPIEDFIKITNIPEEDFKEINEEVDTLAGLILEIKGDFPKRKESITYNNHSFVVEDMSKKRIMKIRYVPPKETKEE
ncbi:MAG: hemolysin family protein [Fermentimonas sp.]